MKVLGYYPIFCIFVSRLFCTSFVMLCLSLTCALTTDGLLTNYREEDSFVEPALSLLWDLLLANHSTPVRMELVQLFEVNSFSYSF